MSGPDHPLGTGDTVVNRTDEVVMRIIKFDTYKILRLMPDI